NDAKATPHYFTYGVLYNWPAAMDGDVSSSSNPSGVQGICPSGWHLPSDAEWTTLTDYLGGIDVAGDKMKEEGTSHWTSPNTGATNESGFSALPGGYRLPGGTFNYVGSYGFWWSSTQSSAYNTWYRYLYYSYSGVNRYNNNKSFGYSLRCIRD
ncbi:MAG TPA: fibrobacter succinogenes major paralogous domain-containing protein, partial [Chitinophagales bacterium]|nr:fibrobacter succinogenes major paralogous domain-containing protein [Chitinophagales bacterium]